LRKLKGISYVLSAALALSFLVPAANASTKVVKSNPHQSKITVETHTPPTPPAKAKRSFWSRIWGGVKAAACIGVMAGTALLSLSGKNIPLAVGAAVAGGTLEYEICRQ
jgi:hypothetical protein